MMIMTIMMHWQGNYEDNDDDDDGDENDASIIGNIGDTDDQSGYYGIWRMTDKILRALPCLSASNFTVSC